MSIWEQRHYDGPLSGQQASQGRERQPSVCACSIWMTLYKKENFYKELQNSSDETLKEYPKIMSLCNEKQVLNFSS